MKEIITASIGGISFSIEKDACFKLKDYLNRFESSLQNPQEAKEVMEDIEARIAEIFREKVKNEFQVVGMKLVDRAIDMLGLPDESSMSDDYAKTAASPGEGVRKRLFRDTERARIAGVCAGVAHYIHWDVVWVRILFLAAVFVGGGGLWAYIILWVVVPEAQTVTDKLQMRGEAITAENIRKYSQEAN